MSDKLSIADYYRKVFADIERQILTETDEYIIGTDIDELAEYYCHNNCLSLIEFDTEKQETMEHKKGLKIVKANERKNGYQTMGDISVEYEIIVVTIPIIPNKDLKTIWELRTSLDSWGEAPRRDRRVNLGTDTISFNFEIKGYGGFELDDKDIILEINKRKELIYTYPRKLGHKLRWILRYNILYLYLKLVEEIYVSKTSKS